METFQICLLMITFSSVTCPVCDPEPSSKIWPLGQGILNRELTTNEQPEGRGIFGYKSSPLSYNGLQFYGNTSSYVDLRFDGSTDDYSLYFFIYPELHGGCILHYKSDPTSNVGITEMKLDMGSAGTLTYSVNGNGLTLENGGSDTGTFVVPVDTWSIIMMQFDISQGKAKITADDGDTLMKEDVVDLGPGEDGNILGPGIMRVGSSHDVNGGGFKGAITCLHKIADNNICEHDDYKTRCESNWPTTTSTTTTSTTTTATTTSTTSTSSSTSTTTSTTTPTTTSTTTTSTTTPTITSTTTPTTSTTTTTTTPTTTSTTTSTTTPTTTSTTTPTTTTTTPTTTTTTPTTSTSTPTTSTTTPTTSTTTPTTSTTTPTTTSTTTPITTTTSPTTSTTSPTTSTTSSTTTSTTTTTTGTTSSPPATILISGSGAFLSAATTPILTTAMPAVPVRTGSRQFSMYSTSADYANMGDVISTNLVSDMRECLLECNKYAECASFTFNAVIRRCQTGKIGPAQAALQSDPDSVMFALV